MRILSSMAMFLMPLSILLVSPVNAETLREMPSCYSGFGDIWGEKPARIRMRKIDGDTIKSLADFAHVNAKRDIALKIIEGGDFSGWDLSKIRLDQVCFVGSNLKGVNLAGTEGTGMGFIKSDLTGANMQGAVMPQVLFRNAKLNNVNARDANFYGGQFDGGWFEGGIAGWNLDSATMTEFKFECGITLDDGCPVYQGGDPVSAKGVNFTRATLHSFGLFDVNVEGAVLEDTIIGPAQLPALGKAEFRGDIILRGGDQNIRITAQQTRTILNANEKQKRIAANASFDCANAGTAVENAICGEYASDLRAADRELSILYRRAVSRYPDLRKSQLAWLKNRNSCADKEYPTDCIGKAYSKRKGQLLGKLAESDWLHAGQEAYFAYEVLELPADFKQTALYDLIAPALVGASRSEMLIKREKDGLYTINGWSVGANAHTCNLSASHLYLDKKSGWFVTVSEEKKPVPIFRNFDDHIEIFANGRPDYEQYPDASNYMSCGMRASFGDMVRFDVDDAAMKKIRSSFVERF